MGITPQIIGNWKMNGTISSVREIQALDEGLAGALGTGVDVDVDVMICPPATLVHIFAHATRDSAIAIGAQDCHAETNGAFTGDIAAEMLADCGAKAVIVGHSERRTLHGETDHAVLKKAQAVHRAGLVCIICIGETRSEREAGETSRVVSTQLAGSTPDSATPKNTVIAYEPVWAIGTGDIPSAEDIGAVHSQVREQLFDRFGVAGHEIPLLYGGSVNPDNAAEVLAIEDVNGALVGGASLRASDLLGIVAGIKPAATR